MVEYMENNSMNIVVKIILLIGVIFCGISLIVPWAGISNLGYYTWGANFLDEWNIFYIDSLTSGVTEAIIFGISMIIAFFITITAVVIGAIGIKNVGIKKSNSPLIAGILSIVAIIFCIIAVSQFSSNVPGFGIGYGAGFFLMIFSSVMFFVSYGISFVTANIPSTSVQPVAAPQQMYYQQPPPTQPIQQQTPPPITPVPTQSQPVQQPTAGNNFCTNCGHQVQGNLKFCPECGFKL